MSFKLRILTESLLVIITFDKLQVTPVVSIRIELLAHVRWPEPRRCFCFSAKSDLKLTWVVQILELLWCNFLIKSYLKQCFRGNKWSQCSKEEMHSPVDPQVEALLQVVQAMRLAELAEAHH